MKTVTLIALIASILSLISSIIQFVTYFNNIRGIGYFNFSVSILSSIGFILFFAVLYSKQK
jgi:hypothetical protein